MDEKFTELMGNGFGSDLFARYYKMLEEESDRGAVLIASGLFEEALQEIISKRLLPSVTNKDPLFGSEGAPLSTFGAKIEMAYRLGVINEGIRELLNKFRKMRNEFAHNIYKASFTETDVKDRLRAIFKSAEEVHSAILDKFDIPPTPRQEFNVFFASQMMALKIQAEVVKPL
ncbi:hypothetical protein N7583_22310 [Serratia marcescens]|uniref:hypothetical protein n=2 Tax=Serratia marcescens TaxID=615 RepID=UPI0028818363|nr:hypothetical protein [Serratia marcescens]MDT0228498.1 hypothetical protein [Serratia marcescens]